MFVRDEERTSLGAHDTIRVGTSGDGVCVVSFIFVGIISTSEPKLDIEPCAEQVKRSAGGYF